MGHGCTIYIFRRSVAAQQALLTINDPLTRVEASRHRASASGQKLCLLIADNRAKLCLIAIDRSSWMAEVKNAVLQLKPGDEVAIALRDIIAGQALAPFDLQAAGEIPFGHKVALRPLGKGESNPSSWPADRLGDRVQSRPVPMSTSTIWASRRRWPGMRSARGCRMRRSGRPRISRPSTAILRADGKVGTRNYVGVLTSVNCSALVARMIAGPFSRSEAVAALSRRRRRGGADPQVRLQRRRWFDVDEDVAPDPGRLRAAPQFLRRAACRAGLRGQPDRSTGRGRRSSNSAMIWPSW